MNIDFTLSKHCSKERTDRLAFIMLNTGLGEMFCEYQESEYVLYRLTTTGVLLVINPIEMLLISAYYVDAEKATAIMRHSPNRTASCNTMYKIIKANKKFLEQQRKIY